MHTWTKGALLLALVLALVPGTAFADDGALQSTRIVSDAPAPGRVDVASQSSSQIEAFVAQLQETADQQVTEAIEKAEAANKLLAYDQADIEAIGSQEKSGHTICCPSYACAYADAVLDGTVHSHEYYTCSCCTWTDWGGGNSSFRNVGSNEQLLREAYDQIAAGKPTVIHVTWSGGEHWIALIGYENVDDPDHLTLSNFIALDPWDGAQLNAGSKYSLYGDGCEHISER